MDTPEFAALSAEHETRGAAVRALKAAKVAADSAEFQAALEGLKAIKLEMERVAPGSTAPPGKDKKKKEKGGEAGPSKKELRKRAKEAELGNAVTESFEKLESGSARFAVLPMIRSETQERPTLVPLESLNASMEGQVVHLRARVHQTRGKGKVGFLVLRDRLATAQVSIYVEGEITKEIVKWVSNIPRESVVDVIAKVIKTESPVAGCTQSDIELAEVQSVGIISLSTLLPFNIEDASRKIEGGAALDEGDNGGQPAAAGADSYDTLTVNRDLRLDNRWVDLRTPANQAIFRIESAVSMYFRQYLFENDFVEIHTPKIIGAASESGASVFRLGYFEKDAFLAQSPQLYKQMAIAAGFKRVFTTGGVFRAENANTHRHLCEFVGLDLEMEIVSHYQEVLDTFGALFAYIFDKINANFGAELEAVRAQYPSEPLRYNSDGKMLVIPFSEGIELLRGSGDPLAEGVSEYEDIDTPQERLLGKLVAEKYGTDLYAMDRFPTSARPFYTMLCADDKRLSCSYDIYLRGQEILSGAQRVSDYAMLTERVKEMQVDGVQDYVDSFKHGCPPHGGGGIGMERVVMLFLGLSNIRLTSMFPRTPVRLTP
jgi:nondiscriminating aspartyl-tRNA synthetase|eukprot:TRINITY_DN12206_c0_g1_i1.p1 TRINITY_DN12206_c0_g1~~TRINITY_DN12206_c0_g1_i1.p1  ORF type:complete len:625 (-),score=340.61 TRINITY_DN12206_c0_g1_i1:55-1857(-)